MYGDECGQCLPEVLRHRCVSKEVSWVKEGFDMQSVPFSVPNIDKNPILTGEIRVTCCYCEDSVQNSCNSFPSCVCSYTSLASALQSALHPK